MANKLDKKILHGMVNYGTQAGVLALGLRNRGVEAMAIVYPDKMKRLCDLELLGGGNFLQKIIKYSWNHLRSIYWFFYFDIFHFYYGITLFPRQLDLPFYKIFRKKVVMHYLGNDVQGYERSVSQYKWTNMPGYMEGRDPKKYDQFIEKRLSNESRYVDLQLVCAPYLSEFVPRSKIFPLALNLERYQFKDLASGTTIKILHAPSHRGIKGTEFIIETINKLISQGFSINFRCIENVSHDQLLEHYAWCDLFIDQIMGGWYGTAAIEAMAVGRPVVCSIRESYFAHIDYGLEIPILHADPDSIFLVLKKIVSDAHELQELGLKSRKFVEKFHDSNYLTQKLIQMYRELE